ncbi:MAG: hypothetical protein ACHQZQ_02560 [SAR324 cluster bacterium]
MAPHCGVRTRTLPRLAVVRLDVFAFAPVPAAQMTEGFRKAFADTGAYELVNLGASAGVPCRNLACALAVGRRARATLVVYGDIVELDPDNWLISATLASVDSGQAIRAVTLDQAGSPATQFTAGFKTLAYRLAGVQEEIAAGPAPVSPPSPKPAQEHTGPKQGFGIALGNETLSGKLVTQGASVPYTIEGIGFGLDYQLPIAKWLSVGLYLRGVPDGNVGGQVAGAFSQGSSYGLGTEVRIWIGQAFIGGSGEAASTTFSALKGGMTGVVDKSFNLSGSGTGAVVGYEWRAGWQILVSYESTSLSGNLKLNMNNGPNGSNSSSQPITVPFTTKESKTLALIGYRF